MSGDTLRITLTGAAATGLASFALFPAYDEQGWFWPAMLTVSFVAVVGLGLRRLGTPMPLVPLAQLAALGWAYVLVFAREDLRWGFLPSRAAVDPLGQQIDEGLAIVLRQAAPIPYEPDLVLVTALGVGLIAVAVDALAATFRLVPWAGLPLLLPYSIPATTVSGGLSELAFAPVAIGYLLMLTSERRERLDYWGRPIGSTDSTTGLQRITSETGRTRLLGQAGQRVGAAVIGLAIAVPAVVPALPEGVVVTGAGFGLGAGSGGTGGGSGPIEVDNPVVDLKRNLTRGADVRMLTYRTDADPAELGYLRMVVLDQFDGRRWSPSPRQVSASRGSGHTGRLPEPPGLSATVDRREVTTRFQLTDQLRSTWLPAFYPPISVTGKDDWRYDPETLEIVNEGDDRPGYQVTSLSIPYNGEDLAAVGRPPADVEDRYLDLPRDTPRRVHDLAERVVADTDNPYQQAVELQAWFRTEFEYSLDVQRSHSDTALIAFLTDKTGYCEQFAATMAIMARSLGMPARVAVGYMKGDAIGAGRYEVTGHDAHAWPELYFAGYGWVPFEPTPDGDRIPNPPPWTDPDTQQDPPAGQPPGNPPSDPANPTAGPTDPSRTPPLTGGGQAPNPPGADGAGGAGGGGIDPLPFALGGLALLVLAVPATVRVLVRRARLAPTEPHQLVEGCWRELAASVHDIGLYWDAAATPRAIGARFTPTMATPEAIAALERTVRAVEQTWYAPQPANPASLAKDTRKVIAALRAHSSPPLRIQALLLPPSLWSAVTAAIRPLTFPRLVGARQSVQQECRPAST